MTTYYRTTYYRVQAKDVDIFETYSAELTADVDGVDLEDIFELYNVSDIEELEDVLADNETLFYDESGHFGEGLYHNGVCCTDSLESLQNYFYVSSTRGLEHSEIVVFEGDYQGSCIDGDVVLPTQIVETLDISYLIRR